jgi:hypothetical protein
MSHYPTPQKKNSIIYLAVRYLCDYGMILLTLFLGNIIPHKIPVNVYIPSSSSASVPLFDPSPTSRSRASVHLTFPERSIPGLVQISVTHDVTQHRGVAVELTGAMGADVSTDVLEEVVRRGGLFGLPGRVWARAQIPVRTSMMMLMCKLTDRVITGTLRSVCLVQNADINNFPFDIRTWPRRLHL